MCYSSFIANPNRSLKMNYVLTDNATGTEYVQAFTANDFAAGAVVDGAEPTEEQARRQIAIWNRSQVAHRQEFSYRLV